mmetsp:Transcript_64468/g.127334  ORF Transcript_64468/g.127334 Transcript_64468/m.127334 type:complete len:130 (-) Transcript_64468:185-574(-)
MRKPARHLNEQVLSTVKPTAFELIMVEWADDDPTRNAKVDRLLKQKRMQLHKVLGNDMQGAQASGGLSRVYANARFLAKWKHFLAKWKHLGASSGNRMSGYGRNESTTGKRHTKIQAQHSHSHRDHKAM